MKLGKLIYKEINNHIEHLYRVVDKGSLADSLLFWIVFEETWKLMGEIEIINIGIDNEIR